MADRTTDPDDDNAAPGPGRGSPPRAPRWVKVVGGVALVVVVLLVVLLATGGPGRHGPGRHGGGDDPPATHRPPAGVTEGHAPPPGTPDHGAQEP